MDYASARPDIGGRSSLVSVLLLAGLVLGHGWITISLFGPQDSWRRLLDDEPIVSGKHPQHLYLGLLGAHGVWNSGRSCVYDPSFQAGFLKTPVFNGCRFAELCLTIGGGTYSPAVYKMGLALLWFAAPLCVIVSCRGAGMSGCSTVFAVGLCLLVWWSPWARRMFDAGDIDLLLAASALVAHTGLLVRFHREPSFLGWLGLVFTAVIACFAQPLFLALMMPMALVYYFCYGPKHRALTWHVAVSSIGLLALGVNAFWMIDWFTYWWLRSPAVQYASGSILQSWETFWNAPLWGSCADRAFATSLGGGALLGLVWMNQSGHRPAARLFGLGLVGFLGLALFGVTWEPLGEIGSASWLLLSLCFAVLPAGFAAGRLIDGTTSWLNIWVRLGLGAVAIAAAVAIGSQSWCMEWWQAHLQTAPLQLGLDIERAEVVEKIRQYTTKDARILWEDLPLAEHESRWSALLPLLTGRQFIGGLDPDGVIEHSQVGFLNHALAGRPISAWSDGALEDYRRLYNIGWILCRSASAVDSLSRRSGWQLVSRFGERETWHLFAAKEPTRSFCLRGEARLIEASAHQITLADTVPENGVVVISMHYQTGLRASPGRVEVEREPDAIDPIGFIRLRLAEPAARVTLTWDGR